MRAILLMAAVLIALVAGAIYGAGVVEERFQAACLLEEQWGEAAGKAGLPVEACPHHPRNQHQSDLANAWKRGWIKAKLETGK